ncbi:probable G-protein coupled receptor 139 [Heterodontus francisci]|uniref:probable G-protein coupled receptor 139 n=1 Tax=Heterodontus francisci TaxID=7792 RepID=UPI00355B60AA
MTAPVQFLVNGDTQHVDNWGFIELNVTKIKRRWLDLLILESAIAWYLRGINDIRHLSVKSSRMPRFYCVRISSSSEELRDNVEGVQSLPLLWSDIRILFDQLFQGPFFFLSLVANLLAIVILSLGKCGLSTCTTRYLETMATADLLFIITVVILWTIGYYYFPPLYLNIPSVCRVIAFLSRAAIDCSVWFTVAFTIDRFVVICSQKLKAKYCTEKTAAMVLATTCILLCFKNIPFYFAHESGELTDNVPWGCYIKPSYFSDPGWMGFDWFDKALTPLLPFALILLLNFLTVRHILMASRVHKGLRGQSKGENCSDPEIESRRKSVILLFTISGNFILLWLVYLTDFLYYNIPGRDPGCYNDSEYILLQVGWMLLNLSCCTNTFIYGATQSKLESRSRMW